MDLTNILFYENTLIKQINSADVVLAAGAYPASGSYIDVSGLHRIAFLIAPGTLGAQQTWQVQQATTNNGTLKDVTGAVVIVAANGDGKPCVLEVGVDKLDINGGYKFVTLLNTGGAAGNYTSLIFLGWGKRIPVMQDANYGQSVALVG